MLGLKVYRAGSCEEKVGVTSDIRHKLETIVSFLVTFDFNGMGGMQKPGPCIILLWTWPMSCRSWRRIYWQVEQLQAQPLPHAKEVSQQISTNVCELQIAPSFMLPNLTRIVLWPTLTRSIHKGESGNWVWHIQLDTWQSYNSL